jgi:Terminase-like family.
MTEPLSARNLDLPDADAPQKIVIPYRPRKHFLGLHQSKKRWKFVVAHRRAGKSVAAINEMIKRALENTRKDPPPRYAYVGPSFDQTKDLIWGYLKHFAGGIPGAEFREGDLMCLLPNGATIRLYGGAAAYERMRGLYFDGIMLDEFPLLNPAVFSTVVRPCLADYRGWAIISGTSNGDDHFAALRHKNISNPKWEIFEIPVTETDALHPDEVVEMTEDMTPEEYAREMLCSFDAPVEGSYYGDTINKMMANDQITKVPYQPEQLVFTRWDLGIHDFMSIWYFQFIGREIHFIRYEQFTGKGLPQVKPEIEKHGYNFGGHLFPHDIEARELGSGKSRYEIACNLFGADKVYKVPGQQVTDGIEAVRSELAVSYIDKDNCDLGLSALKNYHKSKQGKPVHNWASHGADAFRTGSMGLHLVRNIYGSGNVVSIGSHRSKGLRRRIRGIR